MMSFDRFEHITSTDAHPSLSSLPSSATTLISLLEDAGFEAWLVGGFVRDAIRGVASHDIDIATNAHWSDVKALAEQRGLATFETGVLHGTITVRYDYESIEVTTFRAETGYQDHRHPDSVAFVSSITEDLARRDFTINAMAFNPSQGLVDPFGGQQDLEQGVIRCVGDPVERFQEDALRIIRGVRFAAQLGFRMDAATERAAFDQSHTLAHVAGERLAVEIEGMLCGSHVRPALMRYSDILSVVLPGLQAMKGFDQHNRWHIYDVLEHTAYVIENTPAEPLVRWAALFHDMGKPDTFFRDKNGVGHMPGHPLVSVEHMRASAKQLHFSRKRIHELELLVRYHDELPSPDRPSVRELYAKLEENDELFHTMCDLMRADALSKAPFSHKRTKIITQAERIFEEMKANHECLSARDLPITGTDLISLGVAEGPQVGLLLNEVFAAVAKETLAPERKVLLDYARQLLSKTHEPPRTQIS